MTSIRSGAAVAFAIAYIVVLLSCVWIWLADPTLLYIGRDADLMVWLSRTYRDWARPLDVTALNPFQGMGSMLMPINPTFNPGFWVFETDLGLAAKFVLSMAVYWLEVTLSCLVLARVLGFSWAFSFAAALWLIILLFPPFNFVFGLQGWLATVPQWGHAMALSNLILALYFLVGAWSDRGLARACAVNGALATGIFVLLMLCLLAAPFYNTGIMFGTVLLGAVLLLSSASLRQALWRIGAGLYVLALCQTFGMFEFFTAAKSVSARFLKAGGGEISFPQVHWPIEISHAVLTSAKQLLCAAGVACSSRLPWPALTGSYWLQVAIVAGAVAVWLRLPSPLSRIGGWFALLWAGLLVFWLCWSLGIITDLAFSPLYFLFLMYPFWAFFSLFALWRALRFLLAPVVALAPALARGAWALPMALPIFIATCAPVLAWQYGSWLARKAPVVGYFPERGAFAVRKSDAIVDRLREAISLRPGDPFRGSVATILGAKGGSLRKALGLPDMTPLAPGQFEGFFANLRNQTGNDHDLLDLWWFDIPTLSEYTQSISRQFMFYVTNFLSDPGDPTDLSFAFVRVANIDVLRAMGVRFVVIDRTLADPRLALLIEESLGGGVTLYLYEIAQPNLGTYSPVELEVDSGLDSLRAAVDRDPGILTSRAFVQSPGEGAFVPAREARMIFERNRVRVVASSDGASMLLLPLQFSHCLRVSDPRVRVSRANLIFTLVRFEGPLDVRLEWDFSFWSHGGCRTKDAADLRALGILR